MALTGIYGPVDRHEATRLIRAALDAGIVLFDTAELYGPFDNETLLANALGRDRHRVHLSTKFGYRIVDGKAAGLDSSSSAIRLAVEGSLRRLRVDRIDMLFQHRPDPRVPIQDVMGTVADLVAEGMVARFGLSAVMPEDIATAAAGSSVEITAVQNEFSLIKRGAGMSEPAGFVEAGSAFLAYSPLGRGLLVDANRPVPSSEDYRHRDPRFQADALGTFSRSTKALAEIAQRHGAPTAAIAIAWVKAKGDHVIPLPGPKSVVQLQQCLEAKELTLSTDEVAVLEAAIHHCGDMPPMSHASLAAGSQPSPSRSSRCSPPADPWQTGLTSRLANLELSYILIFKVLVVYASSGVQQAFPSRRCIGEGGRHARQRVEDPR